MIHCSAHGSPSPRIDWLMGDGSPVLPIPNIREMLVNGSMYFLPFGAESYRHDVHSAVYRCQASNSVGKVLGREITVKAVVRQKYEVQVRDAYVLAGNTGVLRCEIPAFVKEYVAVTSWLKDSAFNIYPSAESGEKHHMLPTGELLIFSVTPADAHSTYRCRTVHHVTGDTVESSSYARLVVTEHRNSSPPRFNERVNPGPIRTGETIVLSCISQGNPPPTYLWFRESVSGTTMVFNSERIHARAGVLVLQPARVEDAGRYVCHANNTAGSERVELEVTIISSLSIHLAPQQVTVDLGKDAEFQCSVTGQPHPVISWAKDGLPVREGSSGRSKVTGNDGSTLRISSIVRDDKGMYQCFAKNDYEMVQATAELRLGDAAPQLLYKFIEQTMQPGPSVSLKCIAMGNPTPHFSWTLDGFPLPQNDRFMIGQYVTVHGDVISHVNISAVRVEDGGEYRCSAVNRVAKAHHAARLNIYGLPHVRTMGNYAAVAGETTVIKCPVAGFPIASITWEKDGQILPTSRRQEVSANGTLVLHRVDSSTDRGAYTCTAKNKQGRSDSQTIHIEVKVPPKIDPFSFPDNIQAGARVHVTCAVSEGDSPLKITWLKDGRPLKPREATTHQIGEFDLALRIQSASTAHNGNYTCVASNDAAKTSRTASLLVHGTQQPAKPPDAMLETLPVSLTAYIFPESPVRKEKFVSKQVVSRTELFLFLISLLPHRTISRRELSRLRSTCRNYATKFINATSPAREASLLSHPRTSFSIPRPTYCLSLSLSLSLSPSPSPPTSLCLSVPLYMYMSIYIRMYRHVYTIVFTVRVSREIHERPNTRETHILTPCKLGNVVNARHHRHLGRTTSRTKARSYKQRQEAVRINLHLFTLPIICFSLFFCAVPPTIAPFSFKKDLSEGLRAQVTCMVEKGDPPFTIIWSKDGEQISASGTAAVAYGPAAAAAAAATINDLRQHSQTPPGLRVTNIDAHSSAIVIERVTAAHTGNYTCLARNSVAEVLWTAELIVRVPPRWVVEPQDARASEGMPRLSLHCHADGFPPPLVTWRRGSGKKPGNYHDIASHEHMQDLRIHSNGSLVFGRVQEDHEGFYLCEAVNGIGAGLSKVVYLTVNVPAHFVEKHRNQTARLGSNASLRCEAKGDHPLKIVWKKAGSQLDPKLPDYRYTLKEDNTTDGAVSVLGFVSTSREDSGRYFCIASNAYGRDEMTIHLYIQEPPDFPRNLHVIEKGSRHINLGWTTSQDGNSPITQYIIEYKTESEVWHDHTFHTTVPGTRARGHVSGLRPAVTYQFRMYADNELGRSQASDVETTTEGEKPGGPPRNLKVDPISSTEFNVTWDPPDHDLWNGEILGYHVGYKEHRLGAEQYTYKTVERRISTASVALGLARTSMPGRQHHLTNLKKFTRYSVVVQAFNVLGPGPMTQEVVASTLEDVPSNPPQDVRCTALSSTSLQVSWESPPDSSLNGILKGYKVMWENMDALTESVKPEMKITTALTVGLHGLEKYTNYSIQALAYTRTGDGVASSPLYCVTEEDLPQMPAGVKAVVSSATSIIVSWQPPLKSNGNITSYNVHIRGMGSEGKWHRRALPPYQTSYQAEDLHKRSQYEFTIAAVTSVGEGPQTPSVMVSPSSEVRAAIYSFGTTLIVPWKQDVTLPCQSVGKPDPSVIWKQWGQIVKPSARVSLHTDGSLQITELHREDSGNYTCFVENRHGSDQITHRLTVQVPPAAPLLHATSTSSNSINVQWKNGDDGGSPIRGYILHYKRESGEWEEFKVSHKVSSFVLSRLWCGNDYQMYLTAYNRIGMGRPSEIVKATTKGSKPDDSPGTGDKFVTVNVSWITLHLSTWNDGGCPITFFELEYRKSGEGIWTLVSNNIEVQKTYTLSELQPGTTYDIRIRAHNNAGSSVAEYKITTLQPHISTTMSAIEIDHYIPQHTSVYSDLKLIVPLVLSSFAVIAAAGAVFYCFRKR
ncbi:hypothetical protein ALC56_11189 [Trachymyrmex septentrionalis]|uniref:Down syndrome cell adhesion molecule-like protein Dscam2 n=1 Tax=Trachymyrmex septentrionalis TaxID=34720 RepID=A0A195F297_9HYME|nr:hypothetical protein ALC56_11189 [Trachymyrmex septentrionalis]